MRLDPFFPRQLWNSKHSLKYDEGLFLGGGKLMHFLTFFFLKNNHSFKEGLAYLLKVMTMPNNEYFFRVLQNALVAFINVLRT